MKNIIITENEMEQRLDRFLVKYLNNTTKTNIYKLIRKKRIKVNGNRVEENYMLKKADVVEIHLHDNAIDELIKVEEIVDAETVDLDIIYEDDEILVVNKPKGLLTHPDQSEYKKTLATKVQTYLKPLCTRTFKPASIQRLDKNTSGLVIFGKTYESLKRYNALMRERKIHKYYLTIVWGTLKGEGEVKGFLVKDEEKNKVVISKNEKDESKFVHTKYRSLNTANGFTLVEVELLTGRTHQIRSSLAYIGHPIVGDRKYNGKTFNNIKNQLLHAYKVEVESHVFEKSSQEIDDFVKKHM
ncbi:MAG: RluA family pseudouridine synthase [Clostridia bacterium]|nr:RluA family pseudouridine synthase [Clostridia bacterium]